MTDILIYLCRREMELKMISIVVKFYAKKDKLNAIIQLFQELVKRTVVEEGCKKYEIHQDTSDETQLILLEEWENQDVLLLHEKSEHFVDLLPKIAELTDKAPQVNKCRKLF
ncbi:MAG: antibiotic biosynthesis monooxygenase [Clostridia bacterium]|nr:antibiotic biosynthesis monooxygenase [Clostridia bacterium]